jgi:hypothetical protein
VVSVPAALWLFASGLAGLVGVARQTFELGSYKKMFQCPYCEKPGISPVRKAIMSPGITATCKSCNQSSTLRYASWLMAMLPGTAFMITAMFVESESLEWSLNICGLMLMIVIPLLYAPLHKC